MHRALVITTARAWPPISGADLRNWQNVVALAELGPVAVASIEPLAGTTQPTNPDIEIIGLTESLEKRRGAVIRRPAAIDRKIPASVVSRLADIARKFRPDAVVVEGIFLHPLLPMLRPLTKHLVLDMHNIESDLAEQKRATRSRPGRMLDRNSRKIRNAEISAAAIVDSFWVCSRQDQLRLKTIAGAAVQSHIVPNGVPRSADFSVLPPPGRLGQDGPVILFVGHLGYDPNVHAVKRLVENILPLIRKRLPRSRLLVAGRNPSRLITKLGASGKIDLIANPVEITDYLAQADVVVVPLVSGGGTRLKILEAMAAGVPVVATPLAAEGLQVVDGSHVLLASSDLELARGIELLYSDRERWQRQRESAWKYAMDAYGPATISRAVHEALTSVSDQA